MTKMTNRIFRSILSVAAAVLLLSLAVILGVMYESFGSEERERLRAELSIAAHGVEEGGAEWLQGLETEGHRFTLISPNGAVIFDSGANAADMENHLGREEIREAFETGRGESERASATFAEITMYQALLLSDGNVLRISVAKNSVLAVLLSVLTPVCIVLLAAIILSAVLARGVASRATAPLNALDLEHPLDNDIYDELSPLLLRIAHQQRLIDKQMGELREKQNELAAITESMNEGLILLNEHGMIVSMNPAARLVFNADAGYEGKDFLSVERSSGVRHMLERMMEQGHGETAMERAVRQYEIDASRITSDGRAIGCAILTFDVTEKAMAERNRREFTANVSHELKTPLQSILGGAELMENGLVKPEDTARFAGNIRAEASRLVTLIDDIIRLSQLDEGEALPREPVDLYAVAKEEIAALGDAAARKGVSLSLEGEGASIPGVRRLLHEIAYNLIDNAIRYNRENGSVRVIVEEDAESASLTVRDTGIGIPKEHQPRVFERFYRVDKSHSKATGGTGLGLSIVKHAVMAHNGEISLESAEGEETAVRVSLPK